MPYSLKVHREPRARAITKSVIRQWRSGFRYSGGLRAGAGLLDGELVELLEEERKLVRLHFGVLQKALELLRPALHELGEPALRGPVLGEERHLALGLLVQVVLDHRADHLARHGDLAAVHPLEHRHEPLLLLTAEHAAAAATRARRALAARRRETPRDRPPRHAELLGRAARTQAPARDRIDRFAQRLLVHLADRLRFALLLLTQRLRVQHFKYSICRHMYCMSTVFMNTVHKDYTLELRRTTWIEWRGAA